MRFRTVAIAALMLVLVATGGLVAYQVANDARAEAAQTTIERNDSLAVEPNIRQKLVSDTDHDPTRYGDSVTVTYNGTVWEPEGNYTYYQESGEIEFERDEEGEADIDYRYEIPENQVADDQLQTATESYGNVLLVGAGLSFVVLLLFIGAFAARKIGVGGRVGGSGR